MAADSRSTHTDALATLGTIINEGEKRDAIHLGVENAIAHERLWPGTHVGFRLDGTVSESAKKPVGIVDPFLTEPVEKGQRFWLIVYPRQITSLRHVWEHPDFPLSNETDAGANVLTVVNEASPEAVHKTKLLIKEPVAVAKQAIRDIALNLDITEEELMDAADNYLRFGEYLIDGGKFEGESVPLDFWDHYEVVTETEIPPQNKGSFLSCSC